MTTVGNRPPAGTPMTVLTGEFAGPGPLVHPENAGFWSAIADGRLCLQQCDHCGTIRFPIAPVCYVCGAFAHHWEEIGHDGAISAVVEIHRALGNRIWADAVPFLSGLVDMADGVRLPGRVFCTCGQARAHGTPVTAVVVPSLDGVPVYAFAHRCRLESPAR